MEARRLIAMDGRAYRSMRNEAAREQGWIGTSELRRELEDPGQHQREIVSDYEHAGTWLWGVFDDLALVGAIAMTPVTQDTEQYLWLWGLHVMPRYRGTFASQALLQASLHAAAQHYPDWRILGSCPGNALSARALLTHFGFSPLFPGPEFTCLKRMPGHQLVEYRSELISRDFAVFQR